MKIQITLQESLHQVNDWLKFCEYFGWDEWCVASGGGHLVQELTYEEAEMFELI